MQTESSNALERDHTFFLETLISQRASRDPALSSALRYGCLTRMSCIKVAAWLHHDNRARAHLENVSDAM